jgi:hypothetical protein
MKRLTFVAAVAAIFGLLAGFALKAGTTASTAQTTVPTSAPHWQSFSTTNTEFVTIDGSQVSFDLNQPTTMLFLANGPEYSTGRTTEATSTDTSIST